MLGLKDSLPPTIQTDAVLEHVGLCEKNFMLATKPENILKRLDWTVIRRLEGVLQGNYRTLFLGSGLDLADLREYQFGDDIRHIDWNVSARMNTPYVRRYLEEREITAWFLLDLSPSVDFGTVNTLKRNMLIDFVTTLARLLTRNGNRVGAVFYNGIEDRVIPAGGGKMQVLHLINELLRQPKLQRTPPTNLTKLLETAHRAIKRRSLIFIVSDFFSEPGWEKPLMLLNRRHEVLAVRLQRSTRKRSAGYGLGDLGRFRERRTTASQHWREKIPQTIRRGGEETRIRVEREIPHGKCRYTAAFHRRRSDEILDTFCDHAQNAKSA